MICSCLFRCDRACLAPFFQQCFNKCPSWCRPESAEDELQRCVTDTLVEIEATRGRLRRNRSSLRAFCVAPDPLITVPPGASVELSDNQGRGSIPLRTRLSPRRESNAPASQVGSPGEVTDRNNVTENPLTAPRNNSTTATTTSGVMVKIENAPRSNPLSRTVGLIRDGISAISGASTSEVDTVRILVFYSFF